jgi:hypothetical protein
MKRLKDNSERIKPGGETNEALLLASVFGIYALSSTLFPVVEEMFPRAEVEQLVGRQQRLLQLQQLVVLEQQLRRRRRMRRVRELGGSADEPVRAHRPRLRLRVRVPRRRPRDRPPACCGC